MGNNKVSENAIWEDSIPPDNDTHSIGSQMQTQPQMMFCYKCNNIIPANSKFCPCCKMELYTECPECGVIYSSQYSICSQCGTDKLEYIEKEREKERIINTKEYQSTYSILEESLYSLKSLRREYKKMTIISSAAAVLLMIVFIWFGESAGKDVIHIIFAFCVMVGGAIKGNLQYNRLRTPEKREEYILQYLKKRKCDYNKDMLNYVLHKIKNSFYPDVEYKLSEWCIEAYIKQNRVSSL